MTDAGPMVRVPGARKEYFAQFALADRGDGFDYPRPASPLIAHLNDPLVLACCGNHQLAFMQVVAAGLFYIDMFAGGTGEDRRRRMPMIRGGDRNRVNVPILKHLAQVRNAFGLARLFFEDSLDSLLDRAAVHVANVSNLRVRRSQVTGDVRHPAAIAADD